MTVTVSVTEAKNRLTQLVREAEAGSSVVITRDDRPVAVLVSQADYESMKRQLIAIRLKRLRDSLTGSGIDAMEIFEESRRQLEERS
ncbi:MAG: type II toxin-antitoxin system Phd/YefM family antitoxin [bacterium]